MADALMRFAQPLGLWLGLAALGVLACHLVRRRARRHEVAFLPLWAAALEGRRGGFGASIVRHLDLLLVLLSCAAVAFAAAGPFLPGEASSVRDLVLVLDGGVGLRAADRAAQLQRVASAEVRRRAVGARIVVIAVLDEGPSLWAGTKKAEALRAVRAHRPGWLAAQEAEALALAHAAARELRRPDLVFCSARPLSPEGFRVRRFGEAVSNAGIATLEVLADPEGRGRIARLGLRGRGTVKVEGHWEGEIDGAREIDIALPPGGRVTLTVRAVGDRFAPDDAVHLILPERRVPRVLVVADKPPSPFLAAALQALEKTGVVTGPLGKTTPEYAAAAARRYDVLIFDRCAPPALLAGGRAVYLAPPPGALPFKVGAETPAPALFDVENQHPLLSGFFLERVSPRTARAILGGEALAHAAPGPVLATGPSWVALGFDPDRCVFAASPAYPLFLRNCITQLAGVLPAAAPEFYAVGEAAPAEGLADVEGRGPVRVGKRLLGPPGFWRIKESVFGVSLLAENLDLSGPGRESDPLAGVGAPVRPDRPLAAPFAAAALVFLLLAWWAYWR